jgi:hypothetical protein
MGFGGPPKRMPALRLRDVLLIPRSSPASGGEAFSRLQWNDGFDTHSGPPEAALVDALSAEACEKAMFKGLCGSGPEARLGLLAV